MCDKQSNSLDKSVKRAPKELPLSTDHFHFSTKSKRQYWVLYPFLNPHWHFESNSSISFEICWNIHRETWLKLERIKSARIIEFCLMILVGISVLWPAFEEFSCVISFKICVIYRVENEKIMALLPWHTSSILSMLGWFLYFSTDFKTGSLINSERGSHLLYSRIFRLLIILRRKYLKHVLCHYCYW